MERIGHNINVNVIYHKNNKSSIKCSLIVLLSILAFNTIYISLYFYSKNIGSGLENKPMRKLNPNGRNKTTDISNKSNVIFNGGLKPDKAIYYNPSDGLPCECEIGDEYYDNQGIHRNLKCVCQEDFSEDYPKFSNVECFFTDSANCNCAVSEIIRNNITFDCLFNLTYNSTFNCSGYYFFKDECDPVLNNNEEKFEYTYHIIDQIEKGYFEDIFEDAVEENKTFERKEENVTYQISTVSSQYSTNTSTVGLEDCEALLKEIYSIDKNEQLILLKLEHKVENSKIPIIEYQLFTKNGTKLDLSYCNKTEQVVSIPVEINEDEEFMHNPNSDFYQDKCYAYTTEYDTDLSIYDRKNNYNEKYLALCEKGCTYKGYNRTNKRVTCDCKTKSIFPDPDLSLDVIDVQGFLNQFIAFDKIFVNFYVVTCYKQLFSSKGLKNNSGSYINIALIAATGFFMILFCIIGYASYIKKINKLMDKKFETKEEKSNISDLDNKTEIQLNLQGQEGNQNQEKAGNQNQDKADNKSRNSSDNKSDTGHPIFVNDHEINSLEFSDALKYDNRSFLQRYISLMKEKHLIISLFVNNDFNTREIKLCIFLFALSLEYFIDTLFFNDSNLHKIYEDEGKYNFLYQFPKSIYSYFIPIILTNLALIWLPLESGIDDIIQNEKMAFSEKPKEINFYIRSSKIKCKLAIFFLAMILLFLFFWYYISCFCAVFRNTQKELIINTVLSFTESLIMPLFIGIILSFIRCLCLKKNKTEQERGGEKVQGAQKSNEISQQPNSKCKKAFYILSNLAGDIIL